MKNNEKPDEKVFRKIELIHINQYSVSARIESLKKSSGVMVVRGRTLPELASSSHRFSHGNTRSDLSK
jgi:hypothetical protein